MAAGMASQAGAAVPPAITPPASHITGLVAPVPLGSLTKVGLLSVSLNGQFQAYKNSVGKWGLQINPPDPRTLPPVPANRNWSKDNYDYLRACLGTVSFITESHQVNNASIIRAINRAFSTDNLGGSGIFTTPPVPGSLTPNLYYGGRFNENAMIVVVNYENGVQVPAFPPTRDMGLFNKVWNAPYVQDNAPFFANDGSADANLALMNLNWPNQNNISWGKPNMFIAAPAFGWSGARVFIMDPKNTSPVLKCFDVTPFFAFEESYCYYCWDTMDRVTDGSVTKGTAVTDPPCATIGISCGTKGTGTTKFYWTVKFNNVSKSWLLNPNYQIEKYYLAYLNFDPAWASKYGAKLDDTDYLGSTDSLSFTVSGVATYAAWTYKPLSDGYSWPMSKISMSPQGFGMNPMCGVLTTAAPLTITELDKNDARFIGVAICQ